MFDGVYTENTVISSGTSVPSTRSVAELYRCLSDKRGFLGGEHEEKQKLGREIFDRINELVNAIGSPESDREPSGSETEFGGAIFVWPSGLGSVDSGPKGVKGAISLLEKWSNEAGNYDDSIWPELKNELNKDRLSNRPLFDD